MLSLSLSSTLVADQSLHHQHFGHHHVVNSHYVLEVTALLFTSLLFSFALSVLFRFLHFSTSTDLVWEVLMKMEFACAPVTSFHVVGPQFGPRFCLSPAPAHRPCHEPLCTRLICFPPSNLQRICIQLSHRFVVKLPKIVCT